MPEKISKNQDDLKYAVVNKNADSKNITDLFKVHNVLIQIAPEILMLGQIELDCVKFFELG